MDLFWEWYYRFLIVALSAIYMDDSFVCLRSKDMREAGSYAIGIGRALFECRF